MQEIQDRVVLHWNYRNLKEIPNELVQHGENIRELHLKRNCIDSLVYKGSSLIHKFINDNLYNRGSFSIGVLQWLHS